MRGATPRLIPSLLAMVVAGIGACNEGPTELRFVNPMLDELQIDESFIHDGGALLVRAVPADPSFQLAEDARIRLAVRSSTSEREEIHVGPELCRLEDGREILCNKFLILMENGADIRDLRPFIEQINGRLRLVRVCTNGSCGPWITEFGAVRIFSGELTAAMAQARRWPGVRLVEYSGIIRIADVEDSPSGSNAFLGGAPLDLLEPRPHDGSVQVQPADVVTVEYAQPDGQVLSVSVTVSE